jgi:hypothetical protein
MNTLKTLLLFAGLLHFMILFASALVPRVLDWRSNLAKVDPFLRRLFWVYGVFIVITIIGMGILTLVNAGAMATGEPAARSLCWFIAFFWLARLAVQLFVFDATVYLTNWLLKTGYHCLTGLFIYLTAVYGWAAIYPVH